MLAQPGEGSPSPVFQVTEIRNVNRLEDEAERVRQAGEPPEPIIAGAVLSEGERLITRVGVTAQVVVHGRTVRGQFVRLDEQTSLEILSADPDSPRIKVIKGRLWFSSALSLQRLTIQVNDVATIQPIGTEYALTVQDPEQGQQFSLLMLDGEARVSWGATDEPLGPMSEAHWDSQTGWAAGRLHPEDPRAAVLAAHQRIQWALYYPAVLDPSDLPDRLDQEPALAESVAAYRRGNLLRALKVYPRPDAVERRSPTNESEMLYQAALRLSAGQVDETERMLGPASLASGVEPTKAARVVQALRVLIAAVRAEDCARPWEPVLSTEWLAESYYQQSQVDRSSQSPQAAWERATYGPAGGGRGRALPRALLAARKALAAGAEPFRFAAVRVAELEFSFGEVRKAEAALDTVLALAPENAQAWALKGFLLSARDRIGRATNAFSADTPAMPVEGVNAIDAFNRAIALDPHLANGWLGRGLCHFHHGEVRAGLRDLQRAVAVEPGRSLLRSYLGKAYDEAAREVSRFWSAEARELRGEVSRPERGSRAEFFDDKAGKRLAAAARLDPGDPTSPLYSALLRQSQNRINEAVSDLEHSKTLNDHRMLFRSQALLDQDQAVRSANLAQVYGDAGLYETSVNEASRAVTYDYANYSAHLFLANSYYALIDPSRFNLRHETVWFNELLLANLLAPVGAGAFSPNISQQEYSRLFETTGPGLSVTTIVRSDEDFRQIASQFGRFSRFDYSLDLDFQDREGDGENNDLTRLEWFSQFRVQVTPADRLFLLTKYQEFDAGDNFQYYDPQDRNKTFRFTEDQEPLLALGLDHAWQPEIHTLVLGAWMRSRMHAEQQDYGAYRFSTNAQSEITLSLPFPFQYDQDSSLDIGSVEVQQVLQQDRQLLLLGGRVQSGTVTASSLMYHALDVSFETWPDPVADVSISEPLNRLAAYAYYTLEPLPDLRLTVGVSYDWLEYPDNWRHPPVAPGTTQTSQWSPKAGLVWNLSSAVTARAAYARSLAGVTLEDSFRLEPAQLAGFPQAFRTLISESLVGAVAAPAHEMAAGALDLGAAPWYATLSGGWLASQVERSEGSFWGGEDLLNVPTSPGRHQVEIGYEETFARASLSRLCGRDWALGGGAQFTHATFGESVQAAFAAPSDAAETSTDQSSDLWRGFLFGAFNHPCGAFARLDLNWYAQTNEGLDAPGPGDSFPMINLEAGYRFWKRRGEIAVGGLNLADVDYRLHPLTPYQDMPHQSVAYLRFRLNF